MPTVTVKEDTWDFHYLLTILCKESTEYFILIDLGFLRTCIVADIGGLYSILVILNFILEYLFSSVITVEKN